MMVLFVVLPLALIVAGAALWAFLWTVRSGQMDDLDTPPIRMLFDDEVSPTGGSGPGMDLHDAAEGSGDDAEHGSHG